MFLIPPFLLGVYVGVKFRDELEWLVIEAEARMPLVVAMIRQATGRD